jgi:hypothetical protein
MNYTKPEMTVLGNACQLIQLFGKGTVAIVDGVFRRFLPAYDLDE